MVTDVGVPLDHLERATPIISGFLLGYVAAIPLFGPLSDARGRAAIYLGALVLFALGSAVTAAAGDLNQLVAGRALQGFAGGALVPVSLALVADLAPERSARAVALGVVAGAQELGSLAGPVYGAAVAQGAPGLGGWRAVFWINLPLAALAAAAFLGAWRAGPPAPGPRRGFDWVGALSLAAAMTLLVLALYPADPARSALNPLAAPLLAAAALAFALFLWSRRGRGAAWAPLGLNVLVGAALVAALAEVPVLASTLFGLDQTGAALLLGRFLVGIPLGALLGGLASRADRRLPAAAGMLLAAACFWRMAGWASLDAAATPVLLACGLGFGLVIAPVTTAVLERRDASEHGAASATAVLARTGGMVAGLALLTAYGFHRFYSEFSLCPRSPGLFGLPGQVAVSCAFAAVRDQFHDVFLIAAGLCVAAAVLSLGLRGEWQPRSTSP